MNDNSRTALQEVIEAGDPAIFAGRFANLDPDERRKVVVALKDAGLTGKAIAPIVGVNRAQVSHDYRDATGVTARPYVVSSKGRRDGRTGHPLYNTWRSMVARCHNPNHRNFDHYGGRGITVCDRWRESFEAFANDIGPRPDGMTLDRIDNDRGYEPDNVRWATRAEQTINRRVVTFDICTEPGCERAHKARGLCMSHYQRWRRQQSTTATTQENPT